ncbi:hypothetical protein ACFL2C_01180 [Patescibacteria group bacterium]
MINKSEPKKAKLDKPSGENKRVLPNFLTGGVVFLTIINLVFLAIMFVLLGKFESMATKHNELRNKVADRTTTDDLSVLEFELEESYESSDRISDVFPNETGLLEFIDGVERMKNPGTVVGMSFSSKKPVKDRNGNVGIPVIIELEGLWGEILSDIEKTQEIPFMFKPVKLNTERELQIEEDEDGQIIRTNTIFATYGGFLYVDEEFSKNR